MKNRNLGNGKREYGVRMREGGRLPLCGDCGGWHARCLETGRAVSIVWHANRRGEIKTTHGLPCLAGVAEPEATGEYSWASDLPDEELQHLARIPLVDEILFSEWLCPTDREVRRRCVQCEDALDALTEGRMSRTELVTWAEKGCEYLDTLENIDEGDGSQEGETDEEVTDGTNCECAIVVSEDGRTILCEECGGLHARCIETGTRLSIVPPIDGNETENVLRHLPCLARISPSPPAEKYAHVSELPVDDLRETVRILMDDEIPSCGQLCPRARDVRRHGVLCEDTLDALNAGRLSRLELVMWARDGYEYLDMMAEL